MGQNYSVQRKQYLDFLKGLCALCVTISHFKWTSIQRLYLLFPFWIDMAVPIFMMITGYVYTNSFIRHGICELKEAYNTTLILQRFKRIILPYVVIFSIEAIIDIVINKASLLNISINFFFGGKGPGSYYTPVMLQVILVFPIIYFAIKKYQAKGFILMGGINALFELLYRLAGLPAWIYRICVLRYFFFLAFGCYLAMYRESVFGKTANRILFCIGVIFIIFVEYLGIDPLIVNFDWKRVSYIAGFYIAPIFELLVLREPDVHSCVISEIGKASFHVFLIQMVYYSFFATKVYDIIGNSMFSFIICIFISIILCSAIGYGFYRAEKNCQKLLSTER